MVLGLLRFTKEDEALFLLDEPDTHLNPALERAIPGIYAPRCWRSANQPSNHVHT